MNFTFTILILSIFNFQVISQTQNVCYVKYKNYKDPFYDYVQWFDSASCNYIIQKDYRYLNTFPVYSNGNSSNQTDTIKYKYEYKDYVEDCKKTDEKRKLVVTTRTYESDVSYYSCVLSDKNYVVIDSLPKMSKWEILEDTATILNFQCQKAITKFRTTKYICYFTVDLPFPSGPKNFRGLPGLILKVENEDGSPFYIATEIIYPFKKSIPKIDVNGEQVLKSKFIKLVEIDNNTRFENIKSFNK